MISNPEEFCDRVRVAAVKVDAIRAGIRDLLDDAFDIGQFLDEAVPKGSHQKRWIIGRELVEQAAFIKACGSVYRRTHSGRGKIESWKLSLLGIINTVHHAKKPKSKKPGKRAPELFLYHLSRTRENLEKMKASVAMTPEIKEEIRRQVESMKESV
jgi:hypothetical protein